MKRQLNTLRDLRQFIWTYLGAFGKLDKMPAERLDQAQAVVGRAIRRRLLTGRKLKERHETLVRRLIALGYQVPDDWLRLPRFPLPDRTGEVHAKVPGQTVCEVRRQLARILNGMSGALVRLKGELDREQTAATRSPRTGTNAGLSGQPTPTSVADSGVAHGVRASRNDEAPAEREQAPAPGQGSAREGSDVGDDDDAGDPQAKPLKGDRGKQGRNRPGPPRVSLKDARRRVNLLSKWEDVQDKNRDLPRRKKVTLSQFARTQGTTVKEMHAAQGWYRGWRHRGKFLGDPRTITEATLRELFE